MKRLIFVIVLWEEKILALQLKHAVPALV